MANGGPANGPGSFLVTTQFRNALTWMSIRLGFHAQLPLAPIWPGLLANAAIYAGVFGMPWAFGILRRRARIRRGCCPRCGYDLRGGSTGPCPECGRAFAPPRP